MSRIEVRGAAENNLKSIDVDIPHNQFTVVTGLSGSGKSSLVGDILQREGQRMYFETFSAYTRSRLGKIRPAKVTSIDGLLPVISIGQTHVQANRRSTAGTFSEISPLLRQLFSRYNDQGFTLNRNQFSFNSEKGWCERCKGLGIEEYVDISKLIADPEKSLREGALVITLPNGYTIYSQVTISELDKVCKTEGFSVDTPWNQLTEHQKNVILYGSNNVKVLYGKHSLESRMRWTGMTARPRDEAFYRGIIPVMEEILVRDRNDNILRFLSSRDCPVCNGERLNQNSLNVTWHGKSFVYYEQLHFSDLLKTFEKISCNSLGETKLVETIKNQLNQLCKLSVGHISANRLSETLSQGELRRMRLSQLNSSGLTGVLFLFDEPSIGLHPRDVHFLIDTMYKLVENGNTVVVVEHNEQIIRAAQHLVELGSGAGLLGGEVVYTGTPENLAKINPSESKTGKMLNSEFSIKKNSISTKKNSVTYFDIHISKYHNISNQTFRFSRGALNVITGVSGAGKSTLVNHGLLNCEAFKQIIFVDQKPIGRTSRSNPATYTGLFDELRKLFAQTDDAKKFGFNASYFSFNSKQGQCVSCSGTGVLKIGMHIFEDIVQPCPVCNGSRYKSEILSVKLNGKSIHEILQLSVNEALLFFENSPTILPYLKAMQKLGLGYLHLGQSSTTLSGGEAQRIKLATSLQRQPTGKAMFVLDEPTTGLHAADVGMLIDALHEFTQKGHTVVVVEHDPQIINQADWIVDLGPEGGDAGGKCLFCGTINDFFTNHKSPTTEELKRTDKTGKREIVVSKPSINLQNISTNNLQQIDLQIPSGEMVAFTGVSGSGKTSLLMDTLHAEGQRLFTENLSGFRRLQIKLQVVGQIENVVSMMPTVAIEADSHRPDIQSTVASISGIYDLLRLLFARFAENPDNKPVTAADFSFANEYSICKSCEGTGFVKKCDVSRIISNEKLPLLQGALTNHKTVTYFTEEKNKYRWVLLAMANTKEIDLNKPWFELSGDEKEKILWGTSEEKYEANWEFKRKNNEGVHKFSESWDGLCNLIEQEYRMHYPSTRGKHALELLSDSPCNSCNGFRLNSEMLKFTFAGRHIGETLSMTVDEFQASLSHADFSKVSIALLHQLKEKIEFLFNAGLGYLPLGRPAAWLSTGEMKWIRLGSILSSHQSGMCLILDEPSSGMDEKGRKHLVGALKKSKERGNTILFSDHQADLILAADRIVELGPAAGSAGGKIVANIPVAEIDEKKSPLTTKIINRKSAVNRQLKGVNGIFPIISIGNSKVFPQRLNLITGPIGCGKTRKLEDFVQSARDLEGYTTILANYELTQSGGQSSVATRTGLINDVKKVFSQTPEAKERKVSEADFSYNSKKSQCPRCKGLGYITTSLDFLPDVKETCPDCNGKRYKEEYLLFAVNGKNISEWLGSTVDFMASQIFLSEKSRNIIHWLQKVGLSYLCLGQETSTLSSGERRRLSLAENLASLKSRKAIIFFDSPTHGLDPQNVENLLQLFDSLIKNGHTIVIAESEEFIPVADNYVRLGESC